MPESVRIASRELRDLALTKMTRVLGKTRADHLMSQITTSLGIELRDANELLQFGGELSKLGGFEGAVGAMLCVQAAMHGATEPMMTARDER